MYLTDAIIQRLKKIVALFSVIASNPSTEASNGSRDLLSMEKDAVSTQFGSLFQEIAEVDRTLGTAWFLIINATTINEGSYSKQDGQLKISRIESSAAAFFDLMTRLLTKAAWITS